MHMFEVSEVIKVSDTELSATFAAGGGRQGGRNWCRCDQCGYAGPWCEGDDDVRLISGTWMVENLLSQLDSPGEFYFDRKTSLLYLMPNATEVESMRLATLETLLELRGTGSNPVEVKLNNIRSLCSLPPPDHMTTLTVAISPPPATPSRRT